MRRAAAALVLLAALASAPAARADFGFEPGADGFSIATVAEGGGPATLAGSHPYQLNLEIGLNASGPPGAGFPDGDLRDLAIRMPPGMTLNPSVVPTCAPSVFNTPRSSPFGESRSGESCPAASQVGTVELLTSREGGAVRRFGVFNLKAPHGTAARLGFAPYGVPVVLDAKLSPLPDGRYLPTLEARNMPQAIDVHGLRLVLWGVPWGVSRNGERGNCLNELEPDFPWAKCSVGDPALFPPEAFLTLPLTCAETLQFAATARSWQGATASTGAPSRGLDGEVHPLVGCASVPFEPDPAAFLRIDRASSPSGFRFRLSQDGQGIVRPSGRAPASPRRIVVELPPGTTVNPSVGAGLGVCSPGEFAAESAAGPAGTGCPDSSKIGEFEASTPLFEGERFQGSVYLASPDDPTTSAAGAENPFDSLLALYLVTRLPARGLVVKVAGEISADPATGDLTATFDQLPQLPYTDLQLDLRPGHRGFLASPPRCGTVLTRIELTPWAGAGPVAAATPSRIESGHDNGPCPSGSPPFDPDVVSGGVNAQVGAYTPYFVRLSRSDAEQEITSYSLVLPKGVTGRLAGIPFCSEEAIARARGNRGFEEIANPSCPAASQVGRVNTGYGVGRALAYSPGRIYLAGPYNGQPLSLVTVNAATVGPIDLGTYVIRSAFSVDRRTAQLRIDAGSSDPIPHIVDGIPLHLRDIRIHIDRHRFTRNPSSCEPSQMISAVTGSGSRFDDPSDDSTATVRRHFQLFNCLVLGFRPRLGLRLRGGVRRGAYPSLRATFASRGARDSNLKRISVAMPRSLFLAQNHIRRICTRAQFDAERCPRGSVYGRAVAHTQLLGEPMRGFVYLRSNGGARRLPDLVATLRSGEVRIDLEGSVGTSRRGGIRVSFFDLPDAPIERFVLVMRGGRRGLLVNSVNVCKAPPKAAVKALGQNNRGATFASRLRGQGCRKLHRKRRQGKKRGRARRAALSSGWRVR